MLCFVVYLCGVFVGFGVGHRCEVFVGFAYVGFAGIFCCRWGSVVYVGYILVWILVWVVALV